MKDKPYRARRLKWIARPDSPAGRLAQALRDARQIKGLTQSQAAKKMGVSSSAVQRAEAGDKPPEKYVVDGYVDHLGLDRARADELWSAAFRAAGRQRRTLTSAPAASMVKTRQDLGNVLRRAREENEDKPPSMAKMESRAYAAHTKDKERFALLSRSTANRIYNRRQLPSSIEQLNSYLYACGVPKHQFQELVAAYVRVRTEEYEEKVARKEATKQDRERWRGWEGQKRAEAALQAAGLNPVEPPPRSPDAPWSARCSRCSQVSRVRLTHFLPDRAGCPLCGEDIGLVRSRRSTITDQKWPDCLGHSG